MYIKMYHLYGDPKNYKSFFSVTSIVTTKSTLLNIRVRCAHSGKTSCYKFSYIKYLFKTCAVINCLHNIVCIIISIEFDYNSIKCVFGLLILNYYSFHSSCSKNKLHVLYFTAGLLEDLSTCNDTTVSELYKRHTPELLEKVTSSVEEWSLHTPQRFVFEAILTNSGELHVFVVIYIFIPALTKFYRQRILGTSHKRSPIYNSFSLKLRHKFYNIQSFQFLVKCLLPKCLGKYSTFF